MSGISSRGRVRIVGAVIAVSLAAGAVGCTDGERADAAHDWPTGPTELCGGNAISVEAGKALKVITGASRFEGSGPDGTVAFAAQWLSEGYDSPAPNDGDICDIRAKNSAAGDRLEATWELTWGPPKGEPASKFRVLPMGERALAAADVGSIQFACRSEKLPGSTPAHIDIGVERWSPKAPEGDPEQLTDAYATVAHSFALAMAKELRCENDGGLKPRPVLDPV
ncbi:hypothetical protein [Streptomyces pakalii]|uniref:DUF3558 domain-containing protein n=1 Tax=Streptomyces pakalii TaxID=3036494 RepID=A0ABT7DBT7_9ACTN|nr:hypothetical protein [Streptomyces pakalii]MDJ1643286.1 hypothetical protein [Streptomyces pakalii]